MTAAILCAGRSLLAAPVSLKFRTVVVAFALTLDGGGLLAGAPDCLSPTAIVASRRGDAVFIACATEARVLWWDLERGEAVASLPVAEAPSGLAISGCGERLYVTCASAESRVYVVEVAGSHGGNREQRGLRPIREVKVGHMAMAPVISRDGEKLYVCNRFNDDVSVIALPSMRQERRIPVGREPVAADVTKDGRYLLVAHHAHNGRADGERVAAGVSVVDLEAGKVTREVALPNGSGVLKDVRVSPDGRYAAVTHLVSSFNRVTTQVRFGWLNPNALSLMRVPAFAVIGTNGADGQDSAAVGKGLARFGLGSGIGGCPSRDHSRNR